MDLELLGKYLIWAEKQVRDEINNLTDEELTQKHEGIGRSLRDLVEHLWVTYESYFHKSSMETWKKLEEEAKQMDRSDLIKNWENGVEKFANAMIEYDKTEFNLPISKEKTVTLNKEDYFLLYTDHQTYHRGQIVTLIKYLGKKGVNTDYFTYIFNINK